MKTPLLFLYLSIIGMVSHPLHSQQLKDSAALFYQAIVAPNSDSDIPRAINYYGLKKKDALNRDDTLAAIRNLRLMAMGEFKIGNTYDSENTVVEALGLVDSNSQKDTLVENRKALYNQLGQVYRETDNYAKAIDIYNLSLNYARSLADTITLLNNKANVYKDMGQYAKAAKNLGLAHALLEGSNDSLRLAMVLDNLGMVQAKLKQPEALSHLTRALQIRERKNDLSKTYPSYKNLALYYFDTQDIKQAQMYADKAYRAAAALNSSSYLEDALSLYVTINQDPKIVAFKNIRDSIDKQKQLAQNKYAFIKYNVEKEKERTAQAELAREKEKAQKTLYLFLAVAVILVGTIVYIRLRERHRREKLLQVHQTEARISKKVHDEVANDIYRLMAKMQAKNMGEDTLLDDLDRIYGKTRDISKEHRALDIGPNFGQQLNELLASYQTQTTGISTRNLAAIDWDLVPRTKKETIYRVLQELMTNMKKHSQASAVLLSFRQNGKNITVEYTDNGKGCTLKNKNGLQNAENRIHAIKGSITFETEPGHGFRSKIEI